MDFRTHKILLTVLFVLIIVAMVGDGVASLVMFIISLSDDLTKGLAFIYILTLIFGEALLVALLFLTKALKADFEDATSAHYYLTKRTAQQEAKLMRRIDQLENSLKKLDPAFAEIKEKEKEAAKAKETKYKPIVQPVTPKPAPQAKKEEPKKPTDTIDYEKMRAESGPLEVGGKVILTTNYVVGGVRYERGSKGTIKDIKKFSSFTTYAIELDGHPGSIINVTGDNIVSVK